MEHLYEKLRKNGQSDFYPMHMPGHKRRLYGWMPEEFFHMDITEIEGFDNLHQPQDILRDLQKRAAVLYGAEESFYLVNGSTCGILSAVSAVLPEGGSLLICRNCHRSVYHAAYLRNLTLNFLYPELLADYDICEAVRPRQVKQALAENRDIGAVLVVSPTYEGRIADIGEIARIVHEKGIPLIVDEAHGAHLGFHEAFARNSCKLGADLVIHSVHKTLAGLTQSALLHVNGTLVDRERLKRFLHIYQSSSPSYILMAGIDNALTLIEREGDRLFHELAENWNALTEKLKELKNLAILSDGAGRQDIGKLVISSREIGLSGQHLYDMLLKEFHLQTEMAAGSYCLAMFTIGDDLQGFYRMKKALFELDTALGKAQKENIQDQVPADELSLSRLWACLGGLNTVKTVMSLTHAWDQPAEDCLLRDCVGRIAGEFVNLYPPGTPIVIPGELLNTSQVQLVEEYLALGLNVQGVRSTPEGYRMRVLNCVL